jgi:dephospho-CoA kinase
MGRKRRLVLGLTGSIGSGKSTVAELFRQHGALLISADRISRELLAPGGAGSGLLRQALGGRFFDGNLELDRAALRRAIFAEPDLRRKVDAVLHPLIRERIAELLAAGERPLPVATRTPIFRGVVVEVPLLFEAGWQDDFDCVVTVQADEQQALDRLRQRDGVSRAEAAAAIAAQLPLSEKIARAEYLIDNRGSLDETARQVADLIARLQGWVARPRSENFNHGG